MTEPMTPPLDSNHGGSAFDGDHHVIHWEDPTAEVAFIVPTGRGRQIEGN